MSIIAVVFVIILLVLLGFIAAYTIARFAFKDEPLVRSEKEMQFVSLKGEKAVPCPRISDDASVHLSVVVPAYNEEIRLIPMLDECTQFLEKRAKDIPNYSYEIIIVSDGSRDDTVKVALKYTEKCGVDKVRVLELLKNRGKGAAVKCGVESSRGGLILFADADGATKFDDIVKLEESIEKAIKVNPLKNFKDTSYCSAISIGSRAHLEDDSIASRSIFRTVLMYGFHFLVWLFAVRGIRDTQCGFKMFTRNAARKCFHNLHVQRWAFDVEILYIAQTLKIPISEHAVNWTEIDGSKVTPFWSWIQMGRDLGLIWLRYWFKIWTIQK